MRWFLDKDLEEGDHTQFKLEGIQGYIFDIQIQEGKRYTSRTLKDDGRKVGVQQWFEANPDIDTSAYSLEEIVQRSYELSTTDIIVTLPLTFDTEMNLGIFAYIFICGDAEYNTEIIRPYIESRTLEAWLEGFGDKKGETSRKLAEQFNCKLKPSRILMQHNTGMVPIDILKNVIDLHEQSLLFAQTDQADRLHDIIEGSMFQIDLKVQNHSIVGAKEVYRDDIPVLDKRYNNLEMWGHEIDLNNLSLEGGLWGADRITTIRNLTNSIKFTAERFQISEYEAWVQTAIHLYYWWSPKELTMTPDEFLWLERESKGEFISYIEWVPTMSGRQDIAIEFDFNDFISDTDKVSALLRTLYDRQHFKRYDLMQEWLLREPLGYTRGDGADICFTFNLKLGSLSDTRGKLDAHSYKIQLIIQAYRDKPGKRGKLEIELDPLITQYPFEKVNIMQMASKPSTGINTIRPFMWDKDVGVLIKHIKGYGRHLEMYKKQIEYTNRSQEK